MFLTSTLNECNFLDKEMCNQIEIFEKTMPSLSEEEKLKDKYRIELEYISYLRDF